MVNKLQMLWQLTQNKEIFHNCIKVKILQIVLFISYVATVLIPIIFSEDFKTSKYCWLFIGENADGGLILNTPFLIFLLLCLFVALDHFMNFRNKMTDRTANTLAMLKKLTNEIPKLQRLCETAAKLAEYTNNNGGKSFAVKKIQNCLLKCLKSFNTLIHAYVDTVGLETVITSNIMASLTTDDFQNSDEYNVATAAFERHNIYRSYSNDNSSQIGWLTLLVSCKESNKRYNLDTFTMKLMAAHCDALVGAPDAWHIGKNITDDGDFEYDISFVNDVKSIVFNTNNKELQEEANEHFNRLKFVNSFVSAPIIYENTVVGIYNVNSSEKLLAGINESQRAILEMLISLFTQTVARCVMLWRNYEFNTKA